MAARRRRMAEALLALSLVFGPAAHVAAQDQTPAPLSAALSAEFNQQANPAANPAAPAYAPELWNDGDEDSSAVAGFYAAHQEDLAKIAKEEGDMNVWPLAVLLRRTSNQALHSHYGLTLEEAADLRRDFDTMTAGVQLRTNCYSYALNHPYHNPPGWALSPGEIAGLGVLELKDITAAEVSRRVEADGLLPAGQEPKGKAGYYLVALFVIPGEDFHFVRQNRDGAWSQKNGFKNVTGLDFSDTAITDPRKADLGDYQFVSYYYVPKGGLVFDAMHLPVTKATAPKPKTTDPKKITEPKPAAPQS